ncbi:MAG: hypothetical protein AAF376_13380, partial [Pseudomonadota bacterium]
VSFAKGPMASRCAPPTRNLTVTSKGVFVVARLSTRPPASFTPAVVAYVIAWRLFIGFGEKFPYGSDSLRAALGFGSRPFFPETTYELEIQVWIPYGLALIGAVLFFVTALYTVWRSLNWVLAGEEPAT